MHRFCAIADPKPHPRPLLYSQFVKAVMTRWPNAILQFEDFNMAHAQPLLERYRDHHLVFNDDIQVRTLTLNPNSDPETTLTVILTLTLIGCPHGDGTAWSVPVHATCFSLRRCGDHAMRVCRKRALTSVSSARTRVPELRNKSDNCRDT